MPVLLFICILYLLLMRNKWMITLHSSCCQGFIQDLSPGSVDESQESGDESPQRGPGEKPVSGGR